jgi:nitrogen fixation NifU-like protein
MTLAEAMEISRRQVAETLGGLPPAKMHCSNLAAQGLHKAIRDYLERTGQELPPTAAEVEAEEEAAHGH